MLDNEDVQKLIEVFATKEDLKEAIFGLSTKKDFDKLFSAVDAYAKKADIPTSRKWLCWHTK